MEPVQIGDLFDEFADDVSCFLAYYTHCEDVDDMVQETFIKAMKGLAKFEGRSNPKTWLLQIARNVAHDHYRKMEKQQKFLSIDQFDNLVSKDPSPESVIESHDLMTLFMNVLQQIKPEYREVILYRTILQMNSEETAKLLGWSSNRVRVNFHRGIKAVRGLSNGLL